MKKFRKNIVLLLAICIIILYFVLKDNFNGIINLLINSNKIYILIAILLVLLSDVFKGCSVSLLARDSSDKFKFKNGFVLMLMANFFNGITPFSLGGQPMELYLLKKDNNIDYVKGSSILFKDFYTYQMAIVLLAVISIIINNVFALIIYSRLVEKLIWIGLSINLTITLFLIYVPFSKEKEFKIINLFIKLMNRLKIVKDKEKTKEKVKDYINNFKIQTRNIISNYKTIIMCIFLNFLKIISICVSSYFCFKSIGSSVPLFETIIINILIFIMASFVPIPGASGGMEFAFMRLFSYFVIDTKLGAGMLMWRFTTYYLPMIYGSVIFIFKRK